MSIYGQNSIQFNAPKKKLHYRTDTSTYIVIRKSLANPHYLFRFIPSLHTKPAYLLRFLFIQPIS